MESIRELLTALITLVKQLIGIAEEYKKEAKEKEKAGEVAKPENPVVDKPIVDEKEEPAPTDRGLTDDISISEVTHWILPAVPGVRPDKVKRAVVDAHIVSAKISGSNINTVYEKYNWPSKDGLDAVCCLFYRTSGGIKGGKFDWWRAGGQSSKTIKNIHEGYGGHSMPSKGTDTWTMFFSLDGTKRSDIRKVTWA